MTTRRTVPRLEAFAYAVRSLWGFHVIYGETGHGNLEMDRSHDIYNIYCNQRIPYHSDQRNKLYKVMDTG